MSHWCRRTVEAGALAVAFLLPLYFNPFAAAPFEPPKVRLFLALVAVMLVAGLIGALLPRGRAPRPRALPLGPERSLLCASLGYAAAFLLATLAAADPRQSFLGEGPNPHGAITTLALVALFLLTVWAVRTRRQLERLVTALLLGTVPAVTYGLAQFLRLDPLRWIPVSGSPVHSTMGNTVYLGAYLAMAAPFTLARIVGSAQRGHALRYGLILALQVGCLFLTCARGAWLGLIAGLLLFLGYLAWSRRSRGYLAASILVLAGGLALLPALSTIPTRLPQRQPVPVGYRISSLYARLAIWEGTLSLVPDRPLLGYGPESYTAAFSARRPGRWDSHLRAGRIVDDPHNILLEHLVSAGVLGLVAFLAVIGAFYRLVGRALRARAPGSLTIAAAAASALAFLVSAQLNPDVITLSALFWLDLALAVAAVNLDTRRPCR